MPRQDKCQNPDRRRRSAWWATYVIRHSRLTGETQIIACEDRDGCTQFVVEIEA